MKIFSALLTLLLGSGTAQAQNWTRTAGPVEDNVFDLCVDSSGILYAVTTLGVNRSTDGGEHWTRPFLWPTQSTVNRITVAQNGNIVASMDHGIFVSTDQGTTFTPQIFVDSITNPVLQFARSANGRIFATMVHTFAKSDDNGMTWKSAPRDGIASNPKLIAASNDTVIAHNDGMFYVSFNNGTSWERWQTVGGLPKQLMILPDGSWICVTDFAALRWDMTQKSWRLIEGGIFSEMIYAADAMHDGSVLFSSVTGVLQLNSTAMWSNVSDGLDVDSGGNYYLIRKFIMDPKSGAFYGATQGTGVWKGNPILLDRKLASEHSAVTAFPNPFNNHTTIQYTANEAASVYVELRDILGNMLFRKSEYCVAGSNTLSIEVPALGSGNYLLVLRANDRIETRWVTISK